MEPIIRGSLRELWWIAATHDIQLEVRHKPGAEMLAAHTLSWAALSAATTLKFEQLAQAVQEQEVQSPPTALLPPFPL